MASSPPQEEEFLGIDPSGKSLLEIEKEWYLQHYRGEVPQLTLRAVAIGMGLGGVIESLQPLRGAEDRLGVGGGHHGMRPRLFSRLIAGESLMGMLVAILSAANLMK